MICSRNTWVIRNIARVVRMARWLPRIILVLRVVQVACIWWLSRRVSAWSRHVGFLSWLWADSPESSQSWRSLVVMVVAYRLAISRDACIVARVGVQVIIIVVVRNIVIICVACSYMIMISNVCLPKLVQDRSWSFSVYSRYLSHYLAIVGMAALIELCSLRLLGGTNLWGTSSLISGVIMLPVLSSTRLVWWAIVPSRIADCTVLLIVSYSILLQ